ncbi:hypothetical protein WJX84_005069 [Apatococcus fuscideae]|uniref:Uncharacterized protein n=1 Tax=Apatococcus fuscideae TaxID=2026836 RepID=A0AAW1SSA8_9CHLO
MSLKHSGVTNTPTKPAQKRAKNVKIDIVTTDVDGTLLSSDQKLTDRTVKAIELAHQAGVQVILATGKAPGPWLAKTLPKLPGKTPKVYQQGLLMYDEDDKEIYRGDLDQQLCREIVAFAAHQNVTLSGYSTDRVFCIKTNEQTDRLIFYGEPTPESMGPWDPVISQYPIQKFLLMDSLERIDEIRPQVQQQFGDRIHLTVAIKGMLEILPMGASKGAGVARMLKNIGASADGLMALGDGENDVQMFELAALGVAMGNAVPELLAVADECVSSNDDEGVAEAIERFVLAPRGIKF